MSLIQPQHSSLFHGWPQAGVAVTCCRPNLSPPRSDGGREGWPPFLSTCSVHMPRCQALSKHFPNARQSCSCTPRNEPLSHNRTFLLLSRECTDSRTMRSSGHKGIHSGTFDHAEPNAPSPEQLSVYYLMYSQPSSPRAGGAADGKLWLRSMMLKGGTRSSRWNASLYFNVCLSTYGNNADLPAVYQGGQACPC